MCTRPLRRRPLKGLAGLGPRSTLARRKTEDAVHAKGDRSHQLRRCRPPPAAPGRRQETACPIVPLHCSGELRRHVCELGIGARDCAQAPALADPIQLRHSIVKALPEFFRTAASGSRLQLIRRIGAAARRRPLEPIAVRRFACVRALARAGSQASQPSAETGVGWCEHVRSKRRPPRRASFRKGLLRVRAQSPSTLSEASTPPWRLADRGRGSTASSGSKSHGLSPGPTERASPRSRSTSARGIKNRLPIRTAARRSLRIQFRIVWVEACRSSAA